MAKASRTIPISLSTIPSSQILAETSYHISAKYKFYLV